MTPRNGVRLSFDRPGADGDDDRHRPAVLLEVRREPSWIDSSVLAKFAPTTSILLTNTMPRHAVLVGLPPDRLRLRLDALLAVEHDDRAVEDAQASARPRR